MTNKPTERKLNNEQLAILKLLFKFRFITRPSITKLFASSHPGMDVYRKLQVLEKRGLIAKHFDSSYRLLGKPAAYYLLPDGLRKLQDDKESAESKARIKAIYKDKSVSENFIDECLDIFDIYISLQSQNTGIKFFTKTDLNSEDYEYFPQPLPDAYIRLEDGGHYFLRVHHDYQPLFVATRAIKRYMDYFENGVWDDTGTEFPVIVVVLEDDKYMKKITRFLEDNLEDMDIRIVLKSEILKGSLPPYPGRLI